MGTKVVEKGRALEAEVIKLEASEIVEVSIGAVAITICHSRPHQYHVTLDGYLGAFCLIAKHGNTPARYYTMLSFVPAVAQYLSRSKDHQAPTSPTTCSGLWCRYYANFFLAEGKRYRLTHNAKRLLDLYGL